MPYTTVHPDRRFRVLPLAVLIALAALPLAAGCDRGGATGAHAAPTGPAPERVPDLVPTSQAPRPTTQLAADAGCVTAACHARLGTTRFVHGVVRNGDCTVCHREDQGGHTYPLRRPGVEGCTFCHATGSRDPHRHQAIDAAGCTGCHDPHGSDHRGLLAHDSVTDQCLSCHLPDEHAFPHAPYGAGECVACHDPHESANAMLLRGGNGPEHCASCHAETADAIASAARVHAPAAIGCVSCHDPHAADYPHALRKPMDQTCFECHHDLERIVEGASAPHPAVFTADECGNCHDPHAADRPRLLRDRQDVLCLQCHNQAITAADGRTIPNMAPLIQGRKFLHGPVASGNCIACHNVHGGSQSRLLRQSFTPDFYAGFDLGNYALCFECHEQQLVTEPRTTSLTDFRDGDVNLHFLHVNRDRRGRTCRTCHEIHGSNLPAHVAESVPFESSQWQMPIGFEQTEWGGSCAPGCHQPETYRHAPPAELPPQTPSNGGAS